MRNINLPGPRRVATYGHKFQSLWSRHHFIRRAAMFGILTPAASIIPFGGTQFFVDWELAKNGIGCGAMNGCSFCIGTCEIFCSCSCCCWCGCVCVNGENARWRSYRLIYYFKLGDWSARGNMVGPGWIDERMSICFGDWDVLSVLKWRQRLAMNRLLLNEFERFYDDGLFFYWLAGMFGEFLNLKLSCLVFSGTSWVCSNFLIGYYK